MYKKILIRIIKPKRKIIQNKKGSRLESNQLSLYEENKRQPFGFKTLIIILCL